MVLDFKVHEQTLEGVPTTSVPRDKSQNYIKLRFHFDKTWDIFKEEGAHITVYCQDKKASPAVSTPTIIYADDDWSLTLQDYYANLDDFLIMVVGVNSDESVSCPTNALCVTLDKSGTAWTLNPESPDDPAYVQLLAEVNAALAGKADAEDLDDYARLDGASFAGDVHIAGALSVDSSIDAGNVPINNVGDPEQDDDAATKKYVEDNFVSKDGDTMTGNLGVGGQVTAEAVKTGDLQLFRRGTGSQEWNGAIELETESAGADVINFYGDNDSMVQLGHVKDPTLPQQVATKNYVDEHGGGGGTSDHSQLTNRNIADQHQISAITGLQTALDGKLSTQNGGAVHGTIIMGSSQAGTRNLIKRLADPVDSYDAVHKKWVEDKGYLTAVPQANANTFGGIKAAPRNASTDSQEVKIDTATGKLYTAPTGGGSLVFDVTKNGDVITASKSFNAIAEAYRAKIPVFARYGFYEYELIFLRDTTSYHGAQFFAPANGRFYELILNGDGTAEGTNDVWTESTFDVLTSITGGGDNSTYPTTKAVADFVETAIFGAMAASYPPAQGGAE